MNYLSVCSGIEAATVAWHPLGWKPTAFAEIEKFPSAVLAHHYPHVPNFGDMTKFKDWPDAAPDVLVGGTPCQSFSVAGLRKGMADPRGNLALVYLGIADRYRPEWLLWENVPGVLSSSEGRDFGAFLGGLAELGYGFAYRVLDAQYVRVEGFGRAVPQRRRRVFVVGNSRDWRRTAAVLFERESLSWDSAPRREAGEASSVSVAPCLRAGGNATGGDRPPGTDVDTCDSLIAHSLRGEGFDASEDGTGTPLVPVTYGLSTQQEPKWADDLSPTLTIPSKSGGGQPTAVAFAQNSRDEVRLFGGDGGIVGALAAEPGMKQTSYVAQAFDMRGREGGAQFEGPHDTANIRAASGGSSRSYVAQSWAVRRLTPCECERLQGFPDGYTDVPWRGKDFAPDGPRYKALGNSMAVNVMRWIGMRIQHVSDLAAQEAIGATS